jgi:hypothetical protein
LKVKNTFNSVENVDSGLRRNDGYALTLTLPYNLISWKEEGDIIKLSPPNPLF